MNRIILSSPRSLTRTLSASSYRCSSINSFRSLRLLSSSSSSENNKNEWRKKQLDKLESKFTAVESEEDLQPMWRDMENRVKRRRPRTLTETGGKSGRANVKKTDEDVWMEQGLYEKDDDSSKG